MKPAPFEYYDPTDLDEALELLASYGDEAKVLAGGQSLGPLLNMCLSVPAVIVDVNRVAGLDFVRADDEGLVVGALARQSRLEDDADLRNGQPLVAEAVPLVGHRAIRNRGTVVGSVAHADPAAEWPGIVAALDGEMVVRRAAGERRLQPEEFFLGPLTTSLEPDELVTEVRLPPWPLATGSAFVELSRRHGDFAIVGVAARLGLDENGCCKDSRIALIGCGGVPARARAAEALVDGEAAGEALFAAAAEKASAEIDPDSDLHASAKYRRHLARVLVARALGKAHSRAAIAGEELKG